MTVSWRRGCLAWLGDLDPQLRGGLVAFFALPPRPRAAGRRRPVSVCPAKKGKLPRKTSSATSDRAALRPEASYVEVCDGNHMTSMGSERRYR